MHYNLRYKLMFFLLAFIFFTGTKAQQIQLLTSGTKTSIRGLCVVNDAIIWASGSNGMVAKSVDGGKYFVWQQIPKFETKDFRDIEAFDSNNAIVMAIAEPAFILKTTDGGKHWNIVFTDTTKGMFLDAMNFKNNKQGVVIGDPINGKIFIATTLDGGNTWQQDNNTPTLAVGEAFFASSGSNIIQAKKKKYFVSGGIKSKFYVDNTAYEMPIVQGFESTGANAVAIQKNKAIVVGGDFTKDSLASNNCVLVDIKKMDFSQPINFPSGYRSSITFFNKNRVVACGLNGVDISEDAGKTWKKISNDGFHVVAKAKKGANVFFAGSKGRIAKLLKK